MMVSLGFVFFATLIMGFPIFLSLVMSGVSTLLIYFPHIVPTVIVQRMMSGIDVFSLLSIPGFILTAEVIGQGQIGKRLVNFTRSLVGHLYGGLAIAVILTCMIFGAISGAGAAAIVAVGTLVYPALIESGYDKGFSIGLILSSSTLAMLVPPGIAMILYSTLTNNSIGTVFMAGLGSGILIGIMLMVYSVIYSIIHKVPLQKRATLKEVWKYIKESIWALGLPVIIVGGIYSGFFTATEAASVAAAYAVFVEAIIYRNLSFKKLWQIAAKSGADTAMLFMLIAAGALLSWVLTVSQVPQSIASTLGGFTPTVVFMLINLIFFIAGMFIDPNSAIIVLVPLVYTVGVKSGMDPIQLAMVIVINLSIGMLTPPFGFNLFVGSQVLKASYTETVSAVVPFILIMLAGLLLSTFIPSLTLWLPNLLNVM